jgi:hypothetical protein
MISRLILKTNIEDALYYFRAIPAPISMLEMEQHILVQIRANKGQL